MNVGREFSCDAFFHVLLQLESRCGGRVPRAVPGARPGGPRRALRQDVARRKAWRHSRSRRTLQSPAIESASVNGRMRGFVQSCALDLLGLV
jgi:hypothetical protein